MDDREIVDMTHSDKNLHHEVKMPALQRELENKIKGEVRFSAGDRALYATDGSNYRMEPIGVVIPLDREDVINTVRIVSKHKAPLLCRGGGTSLAGQCTNRAVVMDMSKYYRGIIGIDAENALVRVLPGTVLDDIRNETEKQGLTFGPDPSTHTHCAIGGMIGNNSCGIHSVLSSKYKKGARVSDNLKELEVMTYDGEIFRVGETPEEELEKIIAGGGRKGEIYASLKAIRDEYAGEIRKQFPQIPRRVSGYNLDDLLPEKGFNVARALTGTEGTCVIILEATLELVPHPAKSGLLVLGYKDVYEAGYAVPEIMKFGPIGLEGIDNKLINFMHIRHMREENLKMLPKGEGWLIVEFGADTKEEVDKKLEEVIKSIKDQKDDPPAFMTYDSESVEEKIWKVRESGLGATAFVQGKDDAWPGWEDSAVAPDKVGDYLHDLRDLFHEFGYEAALYGHFGQGCIHCRINFDLVSEKGLKTYYEFVMKATDLVKKYGGSFSGEHGDGQSRGEFLEKMFGPQIMKAFLKFKHTWDPGNKMNPGKVVDANPVLADLRLGTEYNPWEGETYYKYPEDEGRFSRAVLRCVGVGKCRREEGGTMCPSYMVTREEMHSTRGRARLLFELTTGKTIRDRWKDKTVKESLDLCLSCKGCKGDCPVRVDMATYKSEFLAHYYKGRLRPVHAYVFGLIAVWARIGSRMPQLANWAMHAPVISGIMKKMTGIAMQRDMPPFAEETFKHWFFHEIKNNPPSEKRVIFWADTFNNYFHTEVAKSAVRVLIDAGWHVIVPKVNLCCGRPLYDYGMLNTAKKWLREILDNLREEIRNGTAMVGVEPSCMATFRDELINLFPKDEDAKRLSRQSFLFSEFFEKIDPEYKLPEITQKAIVHGHCQHKAIFSMNSEEKMLKRMKIDYKLLDSGCCGMAGAFGFEKEKYDISVKVGERVLLPEVRNSNGEMIIANGFSCKEQIRQLTPKKALHIAQVIDEALQNGNGKAGRKIETKQKPGERS